MSVLLRRPWVFWSAASLATVVKLSLVWTGWPESRHVVDDAYYYFTIAKHIAQGLGPTFDGLAPTNGFHPLWQLVLVPVWKLFGANLWTPVRVALSLTVLLDAATGWLLWRLVARLAGHAAAGAAALLWFLGPFTFLLGLQGMESSLATFVVTLTLYFVCRYRTEDQGHDLLWFVILGASLGVCGWARTDQLVTVGAALVCVVASDRRRSLAARARGVGIVGSVALAVMAPWFAWCWTRFGSLVQVSGQVKFYTRRLFGALPWEWGSWGQALDSLGHVVFAPVLRPTRGFAGERFSDPHLYPILAVALLAGGGFVLAVAVAGVRRDATRRVLLVFPVAYVVVHALLFGAVWRAYASWYALPTFAMLTFVLAVAGPSLAARRATMQRAVAAAAIVGIAASLTLYPVYATRVPHGARGPERLWRPVLDQVMTLIPDGGVAGAWDAGAVGYVATTYPHLKVVNLDCLVNNVAFEAVREGRYLEYLQSTIDVYLQDRRRARMFLDAAELKTFLGS